MHTPSPDSPSPNFSPLDQRSPHHQLPNPFEEGLKKSEQSEQAPPNDMSVIEALLGTEVAEQFRASAPATENSQEPKEDLPEEEFALSPEEAEKARAQEQETQEHQARAWFLSLGKDEDWIEERFTFEGGITCIAETLDLSNCNITELPSFFGEIKEIKNLYLSENPLTTLNKIPRKIGGDLRLYRNPSLISLVGLEGITVGGELSCFSNPNLASCAGLKGVRVGGDLRLSRNPSLISLVGLEGVKVGKNLYLSYNPNLKSCAGMKRVEVEKNLDLSFSDNLRSCAGLEDVHVGGDIVLAYSPYLTSPEGLPPKENIKGNLLFSYNQESLIQKAKLLGYATESMGYAQ